MRDPHSVLSTSTPASLARASHQRLVEQPAASSGCADPPGAVFVSQRGQVRPAGGFSRALRVRAALRAAAERGAEARADGSGQQHEHDAVGCSLRGVTDSLQNQNQTYIQF